MQVAILLSALLGIILLYIQPTHTEMMNVEDVNVLVHLLRKHREGTLLRVLVLRFQQMNGCSCRWLGLAEAAHAANGSRSADATARAQRLQRCRLKTTNPSRLRVIYRCFAFFCPGQILHVAYTVETPNR